MRKGKGRRRGRRGGFWLGLLSGRVLLLYWGSLWVAMVGL